MLSRGRTTRLLLACGVALASMPGHGTPPVAAVRPLYFEHVTVRDGLSMNTVNSIFQDSQGYIWFATESGLDRYDGYTIREYRREHGRPDGLASDHVWAMAEDTQGNLWLATDGGGVARWDRESDTFQRFSHEAQQPRSLAGDSVRALLIDAQGRIWAGTQGQGLDVLDPQSGEARHYRHRAGDPSSLAADRVGALYRDSAGNIWVGTDHGLSRYDAKTDRFDNASAAVLAASGDVGIRSIYEDVRGVLWLGTTNGGVARYDRAAGTTTVYRHDPKDPSSLSDDRVMAILGDDAQRLWIATANGLDLFNRDSQSFVRYAHDADNPQSLRDADILSLYQDRSGVLWVGTRGGGASHWNPRTWLLGHYFSDAFRAAQVNAFADDGKGRTWIGTVGSGLVEFDQASAREKRYGSGGDGGVKLTDDRVMALLYDTQGTLWVGTMTGGLNRLDLASGKVRAFQSVSDDPATLPANGVMTLYEDHAGMLWVGTSGGGLASIERSSGKITRYPYAQTNATGLSAANASAITEDSLGNLWIGTVGGGLNLWDRGTGRFFHYRRDDRDAASLSDDAVYALHADRNGDLWVGTAGGGLDRIIGSSAQPETVHFGNQAAAGFSTQVVYGIESDSGGGLWLSTNKGLARFDPLLHAVKWFHPANGLQDERFNFNAHHQSADGTLFFGGNKGFNAFAPDFPASHAAPPRLVLTAAAKLDQAIAPLDLPDAAHPLKLAYDDKLLTLDFAVLDFDSPAHNRYSYRLEGFDRSWIDAGTSHRATYTNLDAGDYIFKVRASNAEGIPTRSSLSVPVHVSPAPWHTWWAQIMYVGAAIAAILYLLRHAHRRRERQLEYSRELERTVSQRTRELEERNQELQVLSRAKSDFVARMSHELRTPMNGVLGMTSLLLDTRIDPAQRRFAEAIHRSADSLLAIVDDVLDFSKIEAGRLQLDAVDCDIVELVEQTVEMLAARAATKGIELLCDTPAIAPPRLRLDALRVRQVLVNLGGNAVKFTERGEVTLRVKQLSSPPGFARLRLEVADTGVGIAAANKARIFDDFAQEDASTTRRFGGTGLGLSISRQLVELMQGELTVDSTLGVGSTFAFELLAPLVDGAGATPAPPRSLNGLRVLVVHDNQAARSLLIRALQDWGARPAGAASLSDAVTMSTGNTFDAVVVDDWLIAEADDQWKDLRFRQSVSLRTIRLLSFVSLGSDSTGQSLFDTELTKPLRLRELHRVLLGCSELGEVDAERTNVHKRPVGLLAPLAGRILVVEDQPLNREVATGILASLGLEVVTADDGQQALDMLQRQHFDLVLMDCEMPVMDGFSATTAIRSREAAGVHVPIIALTADATNAGRVACLAAGMDEYLAKPFRREALHALLKRWLGEATTAAAVAASAVAPAAVAPAAVAVPTAVDSVLDGATLNALRALPRNGPKDMLSHIGEMYLLDSRELVASIESSLGAGNSHDLARAAHAWRSYNGNVGAHGLARLCRDLEDTARTGDMPAAQAIYLEIKTLHTLVRSELELEMRKSA